MIALLKIINNSKSNLLNDKLMKSLFQLNKFCVIFCHLLFNFNLISFVNDKTGFSFKYCSFNRKLLLHAFSPLGYLCSTKLHYTKVGTAILLFVRTVDLQSFKYGLKGDVSEETILRSIDNSTLVHLLF